MDKFKHFVGIDISKSSFEAAILSNGALGVNKHHVFSNNLKGIKQFAKWLDTNGLQAEDSLLCLEQTGIYSELLVRYLLDMQAKVWIIMPYAMKHSMGLQRGKTDKIDAFRIAEYGMRHVDKAVIEQPQAKELDQLKKLLTAREQVQESINKLEVYLAELKQFDKDSYKIVLPAYQSSINALKKSLNKIENEMDRVSKENKEIQKTLELGTSVVGVGKITILSLIVATKMFTKCANAKQLACYCGVAPFAYSSGKSINKKPRVHFMANKKMKSLLHMCALSAIRFDPEIHTYYERKVEEGKHKLIGINNVKRKLVDRIFSVVKRQTPYVKLAA